MNKAKRFGAVLSLAVLLLTAVYPATTSAHVLESNNGVSAILHIKPDDRPVSNKPTVIRFLFSADAGGFNLRDYKITLKLLQDNREITSKSVEPAFFGAAAEGEVTLTFPDPGVYTIAAEAAPTVPDAEAFKLEFTTRVADSSAKATKQGDGSTVLLVSGASLVIMAMLAASGVQAGGKYRRAKKPKINS